MMKPKTKIRITFEYENDRRNTYEKIKQIICAARWGTGIDIFGFLNDNHRMFSILFLKALLSLTSASMSFKPLSLTAKPPAK